MSKILLFDTEEEWLEYKSDKISASIIGGIAGLNKYEDSSPYAIWNKLTGRTPKLEPTEIMLDGIFGEHTVRQIFKYIHKEKVIFRRDLSKILVYEHEDYPFISVTPDDEVVWLGEAMNCEIKRTIMYWTFDEVPLFVLAQLHWQMGVAGKYKKTLLIWWNSNRRQHNYEVVEFDEDFYNILLDAAIQFHDFVITDTPPPLTTQTDFNSLNVTEGVVNADDDITTVFYDACATQQELNRVKAHMDVLKLKIAKYMDDNSELIRDDVKLVTYKTQETRRVDSKKLKEADLYDEYSSVTASRKMSIKYKNIDKL